METDALKGLSELFERGGLADSALKYARLHQVFYDSLRRTEDIQRMAVVEYEYKFQREQEVARLEKERQDALARKRELLFMLIIFSIIGIALVLILLYLLQRNKLKRISLVKTNLQLEKSNLEKDLNLKNKELAAKVMSMIQQNELLSNMSQRLTKIVQNSDEKETTVLRDVVHEIEHQHSEGLWKEFNLYFKEIHVDFYTRLSKDYPDLSPNEIKLCAFLKLKLSTKEISQVTRKSAQTIKIARYRLRLKLGLGREENLTIFLSKY